MTIQIRLKYHVDNEHLNILFPTQPTMRAATNSMLLENQKEARSKKRKEP
jgi:hypothetical protein